VGLAQRKIEEAGLTTIALSNMPDLTAAVSAPRVAAIEHPFGRTVGMPEDTQGQRAVLRAALESVQEMSTPGSVVHLPFEWPQSPKEAQAHPTEPPPIVSHLKQHIWQLPRLLTRNVPTVKGENDE
jgi:D-proline reductase (dithiol) PrdB